MANSDKNKKSNDAAVQFTSSDVARLRNGDAVPAGASTGFGSIRRTLSMRTTNKILQKESDAFAAKVFICILVIVVLAFLSLCPMGAAGQYYTYSNSYTTYTPVQVAQALYEHIYNTLAVTTHWFSAHSNAWILENVPGYWAIMTRVGVVGITILCSLLLAVSGALYQNVFKNPMAGPGMLGVGSGVSIGVVVLVALFSSQATAMLGMRYALCYGFGAAILLFVIVAGKKLSGPGKPFDIVTMLLVGSVLSQFLGFITMFVTLSVMDESDYLTFYTISQMLVVDTSLTSWVVLSIACVVSFVPVIICRYRFNALSFTAEEARLMGMNFTFLRGLALMCGAVMILAAQIHIGMVSLVSLLVPFLARSVFGCEFRKQLIGNLCLSPIIVLVARDVCDLIPFVVDGLSLSCVMSVVMLPLFIWVMSKNMRGWE